jgi:HAD superfamily hydrolase (TIGR01549 family)
LLQLKGIIFDMDGTLGNTLPVCFAAYRAAVEEPLGRKFSDEDITRLFGPSEEGILQRALPDLWQERMVVYLEEYERAHSESDCSFPGIEDALKSLKGYGVKLAVVTGKGPKSCAISLRYLGLSRYFDNVIAGSPAGAEKPEAIARVLTEWELPAHQVAYVGDSPYDIDAAREAGVIPVAAAWAETADPEELNNRLPAVVFCNVDDFIDWAARHISSALM